MPVVNVDVPVQVTSQPLLADQVDIGGGVLVYQLKVAAAGGAVGAVTQGTVPWIVAPLAGAITDHSGVTPDALSNTVVAANATRRFLMIQNISNSTLWVNFGVAAVLDQPSFRIGAGGVLTLEGTFVPSSDVRLIGPAGKAYVIKQG